jgi:hypothetical protein
MGGLSRSMTSAVSVQDVIGNLTEQYIRTRAFSTPCSCVCRHWLFDIIVNNTYVVLTKMLIKSI